jgi:RNA recognition motif-containing protein
MFEHFAQLTVIEWSVLGVVVVLAALAGLMAGMQMGKGARAPAPAKDKEKDRGRGNRGAESPKPRAGEGVELYVGNLSYDVNESELRKAFEKYGKVLSARIIEHRFGKSKGYGFVEMADRAGATGAVQGLHNKEIKGRKIVVNEAKSDAR